MGEGPWDSWRGTDSLLERLIDGKKVRIEGSGTLELEEDEEGLWESGAPKGPGQVYFVLFCDFEEFKSPHVEAIEVRLQSCDDTAFDIIRGGYDRELSLLPRYRLSGSIPAEQGEIPIRLDAVTVDAGGLAPRHTTEREERITRVVPVGNIVVGSLRSVRDLIECKMVIPNFAGEAKVAGGGVRVTLEEISPETTHRLSIAESQGKILPGSYLKVLWLREDAGESTELAVNDFGWLLSFYAGRRIHPIAWEGATDYGTIWRVYNTQLITPLSEDYTDSCISDVVAPGPFLQHAWRAWRNHNEQRRTRIRGAVNLYADLLSTTFSTQRLALTTMYLERFRDLMLGSSTLLEEISTDQKKVNVDKMAKETSTNNF